MEVLFVCNGNAARSQEAEAFLNAKSSGLEASSAGVNVTIGKPIDPIVVQIMSDIGYDMSGHYRKLVTKEAVDKADIVISFKPREELPDFMSGIDNLQFWLVPDPRQQSVEFHLAVRDEISNRVDKLALGLEHD